MKHCRRAFIGLIGIGGLLACACSSKDNDNGDSSAVGGAGGGYHVQDGDSGVRTNDSGTVRPATDVTVLITADNAYGFGYGTGSKLLNYFGGVENQQADEIFNCPIGHGPETYTVPATQANSGDYLYIVGYADKSTTQGVLGEFYRQGATAVFTGVGDWEGCATGIDYDLGSGGPTLDVINEQIAACNARTGDVATTSGGWVTTAASPGGRLAFGEDNTTDRISVEVGNEFPMVCGIAAGAHWMWLDWDPNRTSGSAFIWPGGSGNVTKDFVLFRLGAESIPEPQQVW